MRVLGQKGFQVFTPQLLDFRRVCVNHYSLGSGQIAGCNGLLHPLDLYQTELAPVVLCLVLRAFEGLPPEVNNAGSLQPGRWGQIGVGTYRRDIDARALRSLEDCFPSFDLDCLIIDSELYSGHFCRLLFIKLGWSTRPNHI
jgi:hypothetical protein